MMNIFLLLLLTLNACQLKTVEKDNIVVKPVSFKPEVAKANLNGTYLLSDGEEFSIVNNEFSIINHGITNDYTVFEYINENSIIYKSEKYIGDKKIITYHGVIKDTDGLYVAGNKNPIGRVRISSSIQYHSLMNLNQYDNIDFDSAKMTKFAWTK